MQIFELFGSILLKDDGIEGKLDKIDKKGNSVSKSIGTAFSAIGKASLVAGTAIVAGLGWAMTEGVKGVVAMEDQTAQLNAVLKSTKGAVGLTSKEISGMATALQLTTKFAEEDTLAGQNMLLTFTNIGKDVFPLATSTLLDLATAMGTDAKSSAIQMGKALNDPTKGITALSRVGVTFTEEQKKVIKRLQETGDMAGAQKVILAELTKEFGGSAEAAGKTFSGKLVILKNKLGELTEGFASGIMPYLQKFMDWVSSNMPTIQTVMQKAFDIVGKALATVSDFITVTVIPALQKLWDWISPRIPGIQKYIVDMVDMVVPKFQKIVDIVKEIADKIFPDFKDETRNISDEVKSFTNTALSIVITALTWVRDNIPLVKGVLVALTAVWVIHKGVVLAHNIALLAHNIHLAYTNGLLLITSARTTAVYIAQGISTAATWLGTAAMTAFNLVMSLNPIVLVIAALALLGLAIYGVVTHWKDICTWIEKAWNWLTQWNGTKAENKNSTVTTNYVETGNKRSRGLIEGYASGTDYATPGAHWVGENGPEIVNFRGGESVLNARDSARVTPLDKINESEEVTNNINMTISYNVTDKATAEYANNDLLKKLQGRGVVLGLR